jgi:hypothetical protein
VGLTFGKDLKAKKNLNRTGITSAWRTNFRRAHRVGY